MKLTVPIAFRALLDSIESGLYLKWETNLRNKISDEDKTWASIKLKYLQSNLNELDWYDVVMGSFVWEATPEGQFFWSKVCDKILHASQWHLTIADSFKWDPTPGGGVPWSNINFKIRQQLTP